MSDFYTVLKQSIVDRGLRRPAEREAVYGQARAAIIRQLWSYDPPLAEDEIDARIGAFDRTVERVEGDVASIFSEAPPRRASRSEPAAPMRPAGPAEDDEDPGDRVAATAAPIRRKVAAAHKPQEPVRQSPRSDPLAERSAAIEEALRGDYYGTSADESADDFPAEPAEGARLSEDESGWPSGGDYAADEFREDAFDDHEPASTHDDEDEDTDRRPPAGAADRTPRAARPTASRRALWSGLPEKTQVRILIGAIAALGLVVLIAIVAATTPLFSGSPRGEAEGPAQPGGGIITAAQPATIVAGQPADVVQSFTLFDGSDPTVFESSSDNPVRFDKDADGQGFARISSSTASPGVRLNLGPGIAGRLAGQPVRAVIVARSSKENGALNMRFAYQSGVALSHWQGADLGGDYASYGLVWRVPAIQTDPNGDYLLIEPGIPGDGTAADIRSVRLELLAKEPG
jgi:hypothetical protein